MRLHLERAKLIKERLLLRETRDKENELKYLRDREMMTGGPTIKGSLGHSFKFSKDMDPEKIQEILQRRKVMARHLNNLSALKEAVHAKKSLVAKDFNDKPHV